GPPRSDAGEDSIQARRESARCPRRQSAPARELVACAPSHFTLPSGDIMILSLLLLASAQTPAAASPPAPATSSRHWTRMFISPMGEPFRPKSRDDDTLADWFAQADKNHDGRLTLDEMQADAERFFGTLDLSHDGEIDPDDITHYEQVVAPEVISGGSFGMFETDGGGKRRAGFIRGGDDQHQGAGRFGL